MRFISSTMIVLFAVLVSAGNAADTSYKPEPVPKGTEASGNFDLDNSTFDELIDGNPATFMNSAQGTAKGNTSVFLKFKKPVDDLIGMFTGEAGKHGNYYPKRIEWWADSTGDGVYETFLGSTTKLGPADECRGAHLFNFLVEDVHALEMRVTEHNMTGTNRAFSMNELMLITSKKEPKEVDGKPVLKVEGMPKKTQVTAQFKTEADGGPDKLVDGDCNTMMRGAGGSGSNPPLSVFIQFDKRVKDLHGIQTGRSDAHANYYPETMEIYVRTDDKGGFDTLAATVNDLGPADKSRKQILFKEPLDKAYGIELRVTKQSQKGLKRAWFMDEVFLIVEP